MPVVSLVVELRLIGCDTAKRKRTRVDEILRKLHHHLNVAGADLGREAPTEPAILGFAAVGRTRRDAREILERVADAIAAHPAAEVARLGFDEL